MNISQEHEKLYRRLPKMKGECSTGCNECCGPVPFSRWEAKNAGIETLIFGLHCNCVENGKCSIYDKRPYMCRLYGTTEKLKCPHGIQPEWYITEELARELTEKYIKLMESEEK